MSAIHDFLSEWEEKTSHHRAYIRGEITSIPGRSDLDIAKDILANAGVLHPGRVVIYDELVDHPVIDAIATMILVANKTLRGDYGNPESPGVVVNGAARAVFAEDLRMMNIRSRVAWAELPTPC